jgi:hypothetical protein
MQYFRIRTLVDITKTNVHKEQIDPLKKKQQDNYQTLLQALEMRANIFPENDPQESLMDWQKQGYGKKERTWSWEFSIEQDDIFLLNNDPAGYMLIDINYVPFNSGCRETAKFKQNFFSTVLKPTNIIFEYLTK